MHWLDANSGEDFSQSEQELIYSCREEGFVDELAIQECLGFDLFSQLKSIRNLSFDPKIAVVFTLNVTASIANGDIGRRMVSTMNLRDLPTNTSRRNVGGVKTLEYWQRIFY